MISWSTHRREVKQKAKLALLNGNMSKGILLFFVLTLFANIAFYFLPITFAIDATTKLPTVALPDTLDFNFWLLIAICVIIYLLLTAPLSIGINRFFLNAYRGEKTKIRTAFSPFLSLGEILGSCAILGIIELLTVLIMALPLALPIALILFNAHFGPLVIIIGFPITLLALFAMLIITAPFFLAYFVYAEKPEQGALKAFISAIKLSRGVKLEIVVFKLIILPLNFLSLIVPFSAIIINPYLNAVYAGFYDTIDMCK